MSITAPAFPTIDVNDYEDPENIIVPNQPKKAWIAVVLNLFWAGFGQIYLGQWKTGLLIACANFFFIWLTAGVGYFIALIRLLICAVRDANRLNRGEPIDQWGRIPKRRQRR